MVLFIIVVVAIIISTYFKRSPKNVKLESYTRNDSDDPLIIENKPIRITYNILLSLLQIFILFLLFF